MIIGTSICINAASVNEDIANRISEYNKIINQNKNNTHVQETMSRQDIEQLENAKTNLNAYKAEVDSLLKANSLEQTIMKSNIYIASTAEGSFFANIDNITQKEICEYLDYIKRNNQELAFSKNLLNAIKDDSGARAILEQVGMVKTKVNTVITRTIPSTSNITQITDITTLEVGSNICVNAKVDEMTKNSIKVRVY